MATTHTKEQRAFIVRRLAAYYTPSEIAEAFQVAWKGIKCFPADIAVLDPANGVLLSFDEFNLFKTERKRTLDETERLWPGLPETLRIVLLGMDRDIKKCRDRMAIDLANKTAAEMAKILGGFYASKAAASPPPAEEQITEIRDVVVYPPEVKPEDR